MADRCEKVPGDFFKSVPAGGDAYLMKFIDIEMMLLPGGRERTEAEFKALFERNGFRPTRIVPPEAPSWVVEGEVN